MRRAAIACAMLAACGDDAFRPPDVLVFSRTNGYRHDGAIKAARQILPGRLEREGFAASFTEDPAAFTTDSLAGFRAVAFLYTSGDDVLDADGKVALEAFVRGGGGWIGLHSATDTEYAWPFYQQLVVTPFAGHPDIQSAIVDLTDRDHPATQALPTGRWTATDEWYNFQRSPREAGVRILATLDETTYQGGTMGADHPVIWCHERLGGRAFYSELGHGGERWTEPAYVDHVIGGVRWVLGQD